MTKKLISVIVPVYNSEKYIINCIESITNQSYEKFELIVVDDDSLDRSFELIKNISLKDARILPFSKENGGAASARNFGLEKAKGDYIIFIDSDDEINKDYFKNGINLIESSDSDIVIGGMEYIYSNKTEKFTSKKAISEYKANLVDDVIYNMMTREINNNCEELVNCVHCGPCAKIYRKNVIKDIRFPEDLIVAEDLVFNFQVFRKCRKITVSNEIWYYYNQNCLSVTKNCQTYAVDNFKKIVYYSIELSVEDDGKYKGSWDFECLSEFSYALQKGILHKDLSFSFNKKYILILGLLKEEIIRKRLLAIDSAKLNSKKKVLFYLYKFKLTLLLMLFMKMFMLKSKKG